MAKLEMKRLVWSVRRKLWLRMSSRCSSENVRPLELAQREMSRSLSASVTTRPAISALS
jgi:hypothetical protein